jgi:hypothetical protein
MHERTVVYKRVWNWPCLRHGRQQHVKFNVFHVVKKHFTFSGTLKFVTAITKACRIFLY